MSLFALKAAIHFRVGLLSTEWVPQEICLHDGKKGNRPGDPAPGYGKWPPDIETPLIPGRIRGPPSRIRLRSRYLEDRTFSNREAQRLPNILSLPILVVSCEQKYILSKKRNYLYQRS
jgi:hypothetical protein